MNKNHRENKANGQDFDTIRNRMLKHDSQLRKEKRILLKQEERNIGNLDAKQVESLIHKINHFYQNDDAKNAIVLMKKISNSYENGIDILFQRQLFEPILSYLNNEILSSNIASIIDSLAEIIDESFGSISSILNPDLMNILTKLFNLDDTVRQSILNLLSKISNHGKDACHFIINLEFVNLCKSSTTIVVSNSTFKIVKNIFFFQPYGSEAISSNFIHMITPYAIDSTADCQSDIIWIFLYALEYHSAIDLLDRDIVNQFVKLLWNKNESINFPIFAIFNHAFFECQSLKSILIDNEIFECISNVCPIANNDCWKEIVFFLSNFATGESDDLVHLRLDRLHNWIVHSLTNGTYRIQQEVVYFFKNLVKPDSADQIPYWVTKPVISSLCRLLRPDNVHLNCLLLDTLICAVTYTTNIDEMCGLYAECNVVNCVEESNFHMCDIGYKMYKDLISILSGEDCSASEPLEDSHMEFDF